MARSGRARDFRRIMDDFSIRERAAIRSPAPLSMTPVTCLKTSTIPERKGPPCGEGVSAGPYFRTEARNPTAPINSDESNGLCRNI
jgi:hypothetical protein